MRRLTKEELETILDLHAKWLRGESGGVQADLCGVDLMYTNLNEVIGLNEAINYMNP